MVVHGRFPDRVGIIIEVQLSDKKDYRMEDSYLVLWPDGYEWTWKSELKELNDSNAYVLLNDMEIKP